MEPITLTILIMMGSAGVFAYFWTWIREMCTNSLIPWIRNHCGDSMADGVASLVFWLDDKISWSKRLFRAAWQWFKYKILRIQTTYTKTSSTTATGATETLLVLPNGKVSRRIEEQEIRWEELPLEIRTAFVKDGRTVGTVDDRELLLKKVQQTAEQHGWGDELSYAQ